MRVRTAVATLVAMAAPFGALRAQKHIAGFIGGFSISRPVSSSGLGGLLLPDIGVTSTVELNRMLSIGTEARFVRKRLYTDLDFDYVETPLFVRVGIPRADPRSQPFVRLGVAPAVEVRCAKYELNKLRIETANHPDGGPVIGRGYPRQMQADLSDELACLSKRQRTLDFGWLGAVGMSFRSERSMLAVELRRTVGTNLTDVQGKALKHRMLTLLVSSGTRGY